MKNPRRLSCAALAAARSLTGVLTIAPQARSQIDAAPSWVPIGSSASGTSSTVWFHEPASRRTVGGQAPAGGDGRPRGGRPIAGRARAVFHDPGPGGRVPRQPAAGARGRSPDVSCVSGKLP